MPKPAYLRVKVRRRLQRIGALAIKNTVYVLPAGEQTLEDIQWTVREITEGGGEATMENPKRKLGVVCAAFFSHMRGMLAPQWHL